MTVNIDAADGADGWFEHSVSFHIHLIGSSHRRGLDKSLVEDGLIACKTMTRYDTGSKTDIRRVSEVEAVLNKLGTSRVLPKPSLVCATTCLVDVASSTHPDLQQVCALNGQPHM